MLQFWSDELMMICAYLMPNEFLHVTMLNSSFNNLQKNEYVCAFFKKHMLADVSIYRHNLDVAFCLKLMKCFQSELSFFRYGKVYNNDNQLFVNLDTQPLCCVISEKEFHKAYWDMYTAILYDDLNLFLRGLRVAWYGFQHVIKCKYFCFCICGSRGEEMWHCAYARADYPYIDLITKSKKHLTGRNTNFMLLESMSLFASPFPQSFRRSVSLLDILLATINVPRQDGLMRPAVKIVEHVYNNMPRHLSLACDLNIERCWRSLLKLK